MPTDPHHLSAEQAQTISELEALVYDRLASRGLGGLDQPGAYLAAAYSLMSAECILILTGFPIRGAALGETDGPPGALALGSALERLGKRVAYATDAFSAPLLELGGSELGMRAAVHPFPTEIGRAHV